MAKIPIKIGDRQLFMVTNLFEDDEEIDIDKILRVDHNHLLAETLTFSVILNKLGSLLAQANSDLREAKLDLEIWYSRTKAEIRESWDNDETRKLVRGYKYTIDQVTDHVEGLGGYKARKKKIIGLEKQQEYINSIYWAAKSKDDKLDKLSSVIGLGDGDTSEVDGRVFNGIKMMIKKPLIKG